MRDRIKALHTALGLSGRGFSTSIGQSAEWSRTINKTIGVDVLGNILRIYPSVNVYWLINGEGEMFQDGERNTTISKEKDSLSVNNDYRLICEELRYDNKSLREENKSIRELLLKEMQKNQELLIENTLLKVKQQTKQD